MGHGKTEQMVIGYCMHLLGQDPQLRIKIVCGDDESAADRVASIKGYIDMEDGVFRKTFPDVLQDKNRQWTGHKIFLQREGSPKDASLESATILSVKMGSRIDELIFDDIVTLKNAIQMPAYREKVVQAFNTWLTRLEPKSFALYVTTVWHQEDCSMRLLSNEKFSCLVLSVAEDRNSIEVRYTNRK